MALGEAWPAGDGTINGHPIPLGYARVTIVRILDKKYNKIPIEYPVAEDRPKLVKTRALKSPGASASLSLTINCPLMMRTPASLCPPVKGPNG